MKGSAMSRLPSAQFNGYEEGILSDESDEFDKSMDESESGSTLNSFPKLDFKENTVDDTPESSFREDQPKERSTEQSHSLPALRPKSVSTPERKSKVKPTSSQSPNRASRNESNFKQKTVSVSSNVLSPISKPKKTSTETRRSNNRVSRQDNCSETKNSIDPTPFSPNHHNKFPSTNAKKSQESDTPVTRTKLESPQLVKSQSQPSRAQSSQMSRRYRQCTNLQVKPSSNLIGHLQRKSASRHWSSRNESPVSRSLPKTAQPGVNPRKLSNSSDSMAFTAQRPDSQPFQTPTRSEYLQNRPITAIDSNSKSPFSSQESDWWDSFPNPHLSRATSIDVFEDIDVDKAFELEKSSNPFNFRNVEGEKSNSLESATTQSPSLDSRQKNDSLSNPQLSALRISRGKYAGHVCF